MRKLACSSILLALAVTQSAFTCGPPVEGPGVRCEDGAAPAMPVIQVGQQTDGVFTEAGEDQGYTLEYGSQGGQHTFIALRFHGGSAPEWAHDVRLTGAMGEEVGSRYVQESACEGRWTVLSNVQVFVTNPGVSQVDLHVESGPTDELGALDRVATEDVRIRLQ